MQTLRIDNNNEDKLHNFQPSTGFQPSTFNLQLSTFSHMTKPEIKSVSRPWGFFKQYANNQDCTVSLMTVLPGQRLSLQSHTGRAELWIVIDDGAVVQVGDEIWEYKIGDE